MTNFHLITTWHIPAAIENCWFSIIDLKAWPSWWNYVDKVIEIESGDHSGSRQLAINNPPTLLAFLSLLKQSQSLRSWLCAS